MPRLKLLPWPKEIRQRKGSFTIHENLPVLLGPADPATARDVNAAFSFASEAAVKLGVRLPVERAGKLDGLGRRILLLRTGRDESLYPPLRRLARRLRHAPTRVRDQAYLLDVTPHQVIAAAATPQGLYYAAQTLRQLLSENGTIPCLSITDWPDYPFRGVMLDISRFRVPKLDPLFERIERLAALKINVFQLYTEHTFVFRRHPTIGKNCGSMSAEDIIRIDEFCKSHFIDLNANLQSFGHHDHLLSIPKYNHLAEKPDTPWTLCPVDPRTYRLLDDLYSECLPAYSAKLFNASCDETWELGKGRSARLAQKIGLGRVYLGHIKKINDLARKYGKQMMIWADIVLKHPDCIPDIPKNILLLDWGYEAGGRLNGLKTLKRARLEHWTCPGVSTWQRIFPNIENACKNIAERAVAGQESGALGLLNTDWGDYGHAQMPSASCHGYAWGAEQAWTPDLRTDRDDFDRRFAWAWFRDQSGLFGRLYTETGHTSPSDHVRSKDCPGCRTFAIYWDRFPCKDSVRGLRPSSVERVARHTRRALDIAARLIRLHPNHHQVIAEFLFGIEQLLFIQAKLNASRQFDAFRATGSRTLPPRLRKTVRWLLDQWLAQASEFERLWLRTSRTSQIGFRLGLYRKRAAELRRILRRQPRPAQ